jgi:hypothetical protein
VSMPARWPGQMLTSPFDGAHTIEKEDAMSSTLKQREAEELRPLFPHR